MPASILAFYTGSSRGRSLFIVTIFRAYASKEMAEEKAKG